MRFANQLHLARCCGGLLVNVKACASAEELGPLDFLLTSPIYLLQLEEDAPAKVSESPTSSQQSEPQLGLAQATHESIFALTTCANLALSVVWEWEQPLIIWSGLLL